MGEWEKEASTYLPTYLGEDGARLAFVFPPVDAVVVEDQDDDFELVARHCFHLF